MSSAIVMAAHVFGQEPVMRAAFDLGSGSIKIQEGIVDPVQGVVKESVLATYTPVPLMEDVHAHGNRISPEAEEKVLKVLRDYQKQALEIAAMKGYTSVEMTGAASAVFRKATNGEEVLQRLQRELGISFALLPQELEGKLGFLNARALFPDVPEASLISWDSGNGSFQMTAQDRVYEGPLGHGNVRILLATEVRKAAQLKSHESGNPITEDEAVLLAEKIKALLPEHAEWLKHQLASPETTIGTYGDGESIFAVVAQALSESKEPVKERVITLADVKAVCDAYIGKEDSALSEKDLHMKTVTSAVHLKAMMEHFGVNQIHYKRSVGNTLGMLIAPELWLNNTDDHQ